MKASAAIRKGLLLQFTNTGTQVKSCFGGGVSGWYQCWKSVQAKPDWVVVRRKDIFIFNTDCADLRRDTAAKEKVQHTHETMRTDPRGPGHAMGERKQGHISNKLRQYRGDLGVDGHGVRRPPRPALEVPPHED